MVIDCDPATCRHETYGAKTLTLNSGVRKAKVAMGRLCFLELTFCLGQSHHKVRLLLCGARLPDQIHDLIASARVEI